METEVGAKLSLAREVETVKMASMVLGHIMVLEARGVGLTSLPSRWKILLSRVSKPIFISVVYFSGLDWAALQVALAAVVAVV